jgi:hypothetical protein
MAKPLPKTDQALVLRTDFSHDEAWLKLCEAIKRPVGEFQAHVECISDPDFDGITEDELASYAPAEFPKDAERSYLFIADHTAMTHPENPILVMDFFEEPGRTFRVIPKEMWGVENNLTLANMGFDEFADNVDPDGIFRKFPGE